ncbi:hypothetical protein [Desulfocurvus sp.]|jgi:hypothetical protein|uniref:hypothetical protein n=1 Tax=Desulfocurvus sp. TaxID=2871698 RepID=UPI0025BE6473|nr:hypothetical protein [Desulfocurvus sp.]MCK9241393.1 hypothetical protein [Desulfocurvus sp.]
MNLLDKFRLTKTLHDQVEVSGDDISGVLGAWEEREYKGLCEYVTQCRGVIPKYVSRLAKLTGMDPREVVFEIVGAQGLVKSRRGRPPSGEPPSAAFMPEDPSERDQYLRSIVDERKRFM